MKTRRMKRRKRKKRRRRTKKTRRRRTKKTRRRTKARHSLPRSDRIILLRLRTTVHENISTFESSSKTTINYYLICNTISILTCTKYSIFTLIL